MNVRDVSIVLYSFEHIAVKIDCENSSRIANNCEKYDWAMAVSYETLNSFHVIIRAMFLVVC